MEPESRKRQIMIWYVIAALFGMFLLQSFWTSYSTVQTIPYSEFEKLLAGDRIAKVTVGANAIHGTLKQALPNGKKSFFTNRVDPQLAGKLAAHGVEVTGAPSRLFYPGRSRSASFIWCGCSSSDALPSGRAWAG